MDEIVKKIAKNHKGYSNNLNLKIDFLPKLNSKAFYMGANFIIPQCQREKAVFEEKQGIDSGSTIAIEARSALPISCRNLMLEILFTLLSSPHTKKECTSRCIWARPELSGHKEEGAMKSLSPIRTSKK